MITFITFVSLQGEPLSKRLKKTLLNALNVPTALYIVFNFYRLIEYWQNYEF